MTIEFISEEIIGDLDKSSHGGVWKRGNNLIELRLRRNGRKDFRQLF